MQHMAGVFFRWAFEGCWRRWDYRKEEIAFIYVSLGGLTGRTKKISNYRIVLLLVKELKGRAESFVFYADMWPLPSSLHLAAWQFKLWRGKQKLHITLFMLHFLVVASHTLALCLSQFATSLPVLKKSCPVPQDSFISSSCVSLTTGILHIWE